MSIFRRKHEGEDARDERLPEPLDQTADEPEPEPEPEPANPPAAAELVDPGEFLRGCVNLIARTPDLRSTQMIFELATAGSSDWRALGTTRAPFHLSVDTGQLADGSYQLRIESVTAEGQSVYSRRFGPYVVDNTPPAITITKPAQGATLEERAEIVVEVADDASGAALVELSYNDGEEWVTLAGLEPEEGTVRGFWQLAECRPGSCRLRVTAFDRAGNEAGEEITVTIAAPPSSESGRATIAAPPSSESERAPEPVPIPPPQPRAVTVPARPPSASAADRFGQVPSWDWKRHRPSGPVKTDSPKNGSAKEVAAPPASAKPARPIAVGAESIETAAPKEQVKKSAAWTWKPSSPRSEPQAAEEPEPEEEPATPPKAEKLHPAELAPEAGERPEPKPEPESKLEPEPKPEQEPESEPEQEQKREPEEQVDLAEEKPAQAVHLVDSLPSEEQTEIEQGSGDGAPESGAEEGGSVVSVDFARAAHGWDIWKLSALVEDTPGQDPAREEERHQILYHLRQHASVDGRIPPGFENLIYEVFGELMPSDGGA